MTSPDTPHAWQSIEDAARAEGRTTRTIQRWIRQGAWERQTDRDGRAYCRPRSTSSDTTRDTDISVSRSPPTTLESLLGAVSEYVAVERETAESVARVADGLDRLRRMLVVFAVAGVALLVAAWAAGRWL